MLRHRQLSTLLGIYLYVCCSHGTQLYIILIRPERNVRSSMMPVRYSAISRPGTGPSSMMAAIMVTAATCNQNERIEQHVTPTSTQSPVGGGDGRVGGNGAVSSNGATPTATVVMPNGTTCRQRSGRSSIGKCCFFVVLLGLWLLEYSMN